MKIIRGERAGFCMGVALALKKLDDAIEKYGDLTKIYTLGPIIHNPQVINSYKSKGVYPIEEISGIKNGDIVVIRAHGVAKEDYEEIKNKGAKIIDATCPKVKKAQKLIEKYSKEATLLLFGEKQHPEVKGLISHANGEAIVFSSLKELMSITFKENKRYFLAAQTTQNRKEFSEIIDFLTNRFGKNFPILNTICDATRLRQEEAIEIAKKSDVVVVIGGYNSGNTRRLVQVVKGVGVKCYHIETIGDLPKEALEGVKVLGITAGASTPDYLIKEVENTLLTSKK